MTEKTCFVIAPIGEAESDTRKRSDQVLKHIISPAVAACGYKAIRADQISEPGMITSQVIQHIVDDQLVVADLTDRNPNVFYELAIRHAIRKPLVQIIRKGEQIPFDVAGTRTIHVDHHDLDSVENAKKEIEKQVQSLERDASSMETPISVSLDLQLLRQSDNPEQRSLADVLSAISDLHTGLAGIEKRLAQSEAMFHPRMIEEYMEQRSFKSRQMRDLAMELRHRIAKLLDEVQSEKPKNKAEEERQLLRIKEMSALVDHVSRLSHL